MHFIFSEYAIIEKKKVEWPEWVPMANELTKSLIRIFGQEKAKLAASKSGGKAKAKKTEVKFPDRHHVSCALPHIQLECLKITKD